jgi:hypothetical protein
MQTNAVTADANMASQITKRSDLVHALFVPHSRRSWWIRSDTAPIPKANRHLALDHGVVVGPALAAYQGTAHGEPCSGQGADHLGANFLATANAPCSLVSRAIFCASMTSPATRQSLGTKHQPLFRRPASSSSWILVPMQFREHGLSFSHRLALERTGFLPRSDQIDAL